MVDEMVATQDVTGVNLVSMEKRSYNVWSLTKSH